MTGKVSFTLLFFGLLFCNYSYAQQSEEYVRIIKLIGKAEVSTPNTTKWRPARINMRLKMGWDIRTYVESEAELKFQTGTALKIGEKSVVTLSSLMIGSDSKSVNSKVKVATGKIMGNIQKLVGKNSKFEFETPTAVASIRGTRLGIEVGKGQTSVEVYEGKVAVKNKKSNKTVIVETDSRAIVVKGSNEIKTQEIDSKDKPEQNRDTASTDTSVSDTSVSETSRTEGNLFLSITSPSDRAEIKEAVILVKGASAPGAEVNVNGINMIVNSTGSFEGTVPIPDEQGEYELDITAVLDGEEMTRKRVVIYNPEKEDMFLTVLSPQEGRIIKNSPLKISGKTVAKAEVVVNGRKATVMTSGNFVADIPVAEKDIGELPVEIIASDGEGGEDIIKNINVSIDVKSPAFNTSPPQLSISGIAQKASKNGEFTIQVTDRTPEDLITIKVENNNSVEEYILEPNGRERVTLEIGKNIYKINAKDLADNISRTYQGEYYYLPGPLTVDLISPDKNPYIIDDLPPMPSGVSQLDTEIEIEVDDQIGTVPETIKFCRVRGNTGEILLKNDSRYRYSGKVKLVRGINSFTIIVEDIAGNRSMKNFSVNLQ